MTDPQELEAAPESLKASGGDLPSPTIYQGPPWGDSFACGITGLILFEFEEEQK